jgi:hypothetical protein
MRNEHGDDPVKGAASFRSAIAVLAVAACASPLAGCGSGVNSAQGSAPSGRATFTVIWPTGSVGRLVPQACRSVRVSVAKATVEVAAKVVARPEGGGTSVVQLDRVPIGDVEARAAAYPNADGTGVAQAHGKATIKIERDKDTPFTVTMASTIDRIEVTGGGSLDIGVGESVQLTATPRDADGNAVLVKPDAITWTTSDEAVASVDSAGKVTANADGTAVITAEEPESGRSGAATVGVGKADYSICAYHYPAYGAFTMNRGALKVYVNDKLVHDTGSGPVPPNDSYARIDIKAAAGSTLRLVLTQRGTGGLYIERLYLTGRFAGGFVIPLTGAYQNDNGIGFDESFTIPP